MASAIPCRRHQLGRGQASATRTTYEEEIIIGLDTERLQFVCKPLGKARIDGLVGKCLPLYKYSSFSQGPQIGDPYISPLRACAHIDQLRSRIPLESAPGRRHINLIDRVIARVRAQNRASSSN